MDRSQLVELVPHYLAMMFIVFIALGAIRSILGGQLPLWQEFAIVVVVVILYRPVVVRLGWAPSAWED